LAPGVRAKLVNNSEKLKKEQEEKMQKKKEEEKQQEEEFEMKRKEMADNISRRRLMMEQSGIKRSKHAIWLEELKKANAALKEVQNQNQNEENV